MKISSDINVLGSLPDWNLVNIFLMENTEDVRLEDGINTFTSIKTDKSVKRFATAITGTLIKFHNKDVESLIRNILEAEKISTDSLLMLYWNASYNNELMDYLNDQIYFQAFYSGKISFKKDDVTACLRDLKEREAALNKWSDATLKGTASKYLTLLKKFNLMAGSVNKTIVHPYLNDKMFVHFIYWLKTSETKSNVIDSKWLKYSFCELSVFLERVMQKKYSKYFNITYTGDKLHIEPLIPYSNLYNAFN